MKKVILFAIAATVTTIVSAQVQFGLKAGLNLANLTVSPKSDGESLKMKADFHAGALVAIPLFSNFSLQPEVYYSGQGTKLEESGQTGKLNMGYINVPVLFKYNDPSGFFAEIGPQVGLLLSAKVKADGQTTDFKDNVKSSDFSGVLGIGYLSSVNLGIDARYNLGFSNIAKDGDGSIKNGVLQVGVFYMFGHGKKK